MTVLALTVGELVAYLRMDDADFTRRNAKAKSELDDTAQRWSKAGDRADAAALKFLKAAQSLALIPAAAAGIQGATAVVGALVGTIGLVPGAVAAAAAAIAAIKIGTAGFGKAVEELGAAAGGGGGGGGVERAISAARQIASAERGVERAQQAARDAQDALTRARARATEQLEDLRLALSGAALDEEEAVLALERAQQRLADARAEGASGLDLREAELGVRRANQALLETRERYGDLKAEAAHAARVGVEGSDEVVAAQRGVADAAAGVRDAQRELAEAHQDAARGAAAAAAAAAKTNAEFDKLSPNAKAAALAVHGLRDEWTAMQQAVQDALFANLAADIQRLGGSYIPVLERGLSGVASGLNAGVRETAAYLARSQQVQTVAGIFNNVTKATDAVGGSMSAVAQILLDITAVSSEFLPGFAGGWEAAAQRAADFISHARETGQLKAWIAEGLDTLRDLWQLLKNIAGIVDAVFDAFDDAGGDALDTLIDLTDEIEAFLRSAKGQEALTALATALSTVASVAGDVLMAVLKELAPIIVALAPGFAELARQVGEILLGAITTVGPHLQDLAGFISDNIDVLGPLAIAIYAGVKAFEAATVAMRIMNAVAAANPWLLLIAATVVLVTIIITKWDEITAALGRIWEWLANTASEIWSWIRRVIVDNIVDAANWVGRKIQDVVNFFLDLPRRLWEVVRGAGDWLVTTGENLVLGLLRGLERFAHKIWDWVKGIARRVWDEITSFFDILSPSKKMAWVGEMLGQGLVNGLDGMTSNVVDAATTMADAATLDIPAPRVDPMPLNGNPAGTTGFGAAAGGGKSTVVLQTDGTRASQVLMELFRESIRDQGGDVQFALGQA